MSIAADLSDEHIVALYTRMLEAWNRRDADGFTEHFTDECSVIGFDGSQMNGRAQTNAELRAIFASHPSLPGELTTLVQSGRIVDRG